MDFDTTVKVAIYRATAETGTPPRLEEVARRVEAPPSAVREAYDRLGASRLLVLEPDGITPTGPWFTHHLRMDPGVFDFAIVPVPRPVSAAGRVQAGRLPAAKVARTVYHGPYEGLAAAWGEFDAWLKAEGHTPGPSLWECYLAGPESNPDPATWRTELTRPLTP